MDTFVNITNPDDLIKGVNKNTQIVKKYRRRSAGRDLLLFLAGVVTAYFIETQISHLNREIKTLKDRVDHMEEETEE